MKTSVALWAILFFVPATLAEDAKPAKLPAPIVIQDQLSATDSLDLVSGQPCKIHLVKLQAGKSYQISMVRKDGKQPFNPFLRIEDADFKQLAATAGFHKVRIKFDPPKDGSYRIIATCQGGAGEYSLKIMPFELIKLTPYEPGKAHEATAAGLEYENKLSGADGRDTARNAHFAKVFLVKMQKSKTYAIEMDSTQFDSFLRLENSKGMQLAQDDDSGGNLNALIVFQAPEDGVYRVIATTFGPGMQGNFTLRVREE